RAPPYLTTSFLSFLLFSCASRHRHLPSFPTRRSSDLGRIRPSPRKNSASRNRSDRSTEPNSMSTVRRSPPDIPSPQPVVGSWEPDRKSTRLNSSHVSISYAVFCLKKKNSS